MNARSSPAIQLVPQHTAPSLSSSLALFPFHIDEASVILRLDKCVYIYECCTALCERRGKRIKKEKGGNVYMYNYLFIYLFIGYGRDLYRIKEENKKEEEEDPLLETC